MLQLGVVILERSVALCWFVILLIKSIFIYSAFNVFQCRRNIPLYYPNYTHPLISWLLSLILPQITPGCHIFMQSLIYRDIIRAGNGKVLFPANVCNMMPVVGIVIVSYCQDWKTRDKPPNPNVTKHKTKRSLWSKFDPPQRLWSLKTCIYFFLLSKWFRFLRPRLTTSKSPTTLIYPNMWQYCIIMLYYLLFIICCKHDISMA